MRLESSFQADLIKKLVNIFPGCIILKNDPKYKQGIPDLIILYENKWAMLECKRSKHEHHQPNQDYYVGLLNHMSYSSFVYPDNEEEVIEDLIKLFKHD